MFPFRNYISATVRSLKIFLCFYLPSIYIVVSISYGHYEASAKILTQSAEGETWGVFCEFKVWSVLYLSHCNDAFNIVLYLTHCILLKKYRHNWTANFLSTKMWMISMFGQYINVHSNLKLLTIAPWSLYFVLTCNDSKCIYLILLIIPCCVHCIYSLHPPGLHAWLLVSPPSSDQSLSCINNGLECLKLGSTEQFSSKNYWQSCPIETNIR